MRRTMAGEEHLKETINLPEKWLETSSVYYVYSSKTVSRKISIFEKFLTFSGENFGDVEYEFHYSLNEEAAYAFLELLKNTYEGWEDLGKILENEFGRDDCSIHFERICKNFGIKYQLCVI